MFIVPLPIVAGLAIISGQGFRVDLPYLATIAAAAYLFSYLGNLASLRAVEMAPNPGYPLIISKSYVVITSIIAVFLFKSELTIRSMAEIGLIIVSSAIITLAGKPTNTPGKAALRSKEGTTSIDMSEALNKTHNTPTGDHTIHTATIYNPSPWILYSFGAFFAWAGLALFSTWIVRQGVPLYAYLFWLLAFVSGIILVSLMKTRSKYRPTGRHISLLLSVGVLSAIFNLCIQIGYTVAPNPGYINAANAASISLLTVSSALVFRDELTFRKLAGVVGVTAGLIILLL